MTKKEIAKRTRDFRAKVNEAILVEKTLVEYGLSKYYDPQGLMGVLGSEVIHCNSMEEVAEKRRALHTALPNVKSQPFRMWSPHGDKVICSWEYTMPLKTRIQIWYETDIQHIPEGLLTPKCKFVKESTERYNLVCEI